MRRPLPPTALYFRFRFFCCTFLLLSGVFVHGASKTRQPSATEPKNPSTRASMAQVENVLKVRLAASVSVLQVLDRKAQRVQQTVPPASGMLDNFRSWLALKTTKNAYAGGLYPKLERAYSSLKARGDGAALQKSLSGNPSESSVKAALAQQTGQSRALIETKSAHDDTLKYRKTADEKLHSAAEELWRRGEKAQSGELERFRREMVFDMAEAARWQEEGLKAHALALEGYYAATLREPVGGLQRAVLAAAEECPRDMIALHEKWIKEAEERQGRWKARLAADQARCSGSSRPSGDTCKQLIDGDNFSINQEQSNIDYSKRELEKLREQCAPKPPVKCTGGQVADAQGKCGCPSGQALDKGSCVPKKPACTGGQVADKAGKCGCPAEKVLEKGQCVAKKPVCTGGQVADKAGKCGCSAGQVLEKGKCAAKKPACTGGQVADSSGKCGCRKGQTLIAGKCETKSPDICRKRQAAGLGLLLAQIESCVNVPGETLDPAYRMLDKSDQGKIVESFLKDNRVQIVYSDDLPKNSHARYKDGVIQLPMEAAKWKPTEMAVWLSHEGVHAMQDIQFHTTRKKDIESELDATFAQYAIYHEMVRGGAPRLDKQNEIEQNYVGVFKETVQKKNLQQFDKVFTRLYSANGYIPLQNISDTAKKNKDQAEIDADNRTLELHENQLKWEREWMIKHSKDKEFRK